MNQYPTERLRQQRDFIIRFLYWAILISCALLFGKLILPVLLPFLLAFLISSILNRPINRLSEALHLRRSLISVLVVTCFYIVAGGLMFWLCTAAIGAVYNGFTMLPDIFQSHIYPLIQQILLKIEVLFENADPALIAALESDSSALLDWMNNGIINLSNATLVWIAGLFAMVPSLFMKTVITVIVSFFISADYHTITEYLKKQVPQNQEDKVTEIRLFLCRTLPKFVLNYALIFTMTFSELALGLTILGIPYAAFIALLIAILDVLPVLGTGGVLIPWSIMELVLGDLRLAIGLLILYIVITAVRNTVEPKLIGKQMGLHPVVTLAGMLVGLKLFGLIGLFGVPIVLSLIKRLKLLPQTKGDEHCTP